LSPRVLVLPAILMIVAALYGGVARAKIPPPGTHGVSKYWTEADADVTNFSPFAFNAAIGALTPGKHGGIWFGLGQTLEHIDRRGHMRNYQVSNEWLWEVSGISYDGSGHLWFSLGQSGRIGTIDAHGETHTEVLVARRYFSDIRAIEFDSLGTLWFQDVGRRSVGRRTRSGHVKEIPVPRGDYPTSLEICNSRVWVAARGRQSNAIYFVRGNLHSLQRVKIQLPSGIVSIACDAQGTLWFADAAYQALSTVGYIDRRGLVHVQTSFLFDERVHHGYRGSIWFSGFSAMSERDWTSSRLVLMHVSHGHQKAVTLPIGFAAFQNSLATTSDHALWLGLSFPESIVRLSFRH